MIDRFFEWQDSTLPETRKQANESTWEYLWSMEGKTRKRFILGGVVWVVLSPIWATALILKYWLIIMVDSF